MNTKKIILGLVGITALGYVIRKAIKYKYMTLE